MKAKKKVRSVVSSAKPKKPATKTTKPKKQMHNLMRKYMTQTDHF